MAGCFISTYKGEWKVPANVLKEQLGYEIIELNGKCSPSISSKWVLLKKEIRNVFNVIQVFKRIDHKKVIICPDYVCLFLAFLQKLHILKVETVCWYGMFVHSPKWVDILGRILRFIVPSEKSFRIIVFSRAEVGLYAKRWDMDPDCFIYVPYGDWNDSLFLGERIEYGGYFFSGGYSNRDYITLIQMFSGRDERLIIAASKHNIDLCAWIDGHTLSKNITVLYDIEKDHSDRLLCGSRAVILVMEHNTGASGQMVILSAMANRKLVITTHTDVLDEYVEDGKTALVIDKEEIGRVLPDIISEIDDDMSAYKTLADAAYERYRTVFSYEAISGALVRAVKNL